jgi:tetratricopeptide (TPR) repeat protein
MWILDRRFNQKFGYARVAKVSRFSFAAVKSSSAVQAALPQAQKILNTEPDYIPAVMVSALSQEQHGNYEEAERLYEKVLAAFPLLAPATRQLAVLYAQHLGDEQKAYEFAVKAREAFPEDAELARRR